MKAQAHWMHKSLNPGEAVCYWQIGTTTEDRFDVVDSPMKGEMDPFFFLTKVKNFIPHEYPCRTAFADVHRNRRPDVRGKFDGTRWWMPFGSPRLDLSGFWFRPTRLATWARTYIHTDAACDARFRLGTCGGAVIWHGHQEIGWMAPYSRNLEAKQDFQLQLSAGFNEVIIFFDDLAERDTRYLFQFDYLSGSNVNVALPIPVTGAVAEGLEATLEGMYFDRAHYLTGDIRLCLTNPLPVETKVNVAVEGDFMSTERFDYDYTLPAGAERLRVGASGDAPADFRHFRVTMNVDGFSVSRSIGVEICHVERQGEASADQNLRIQEVLDEVSEHSERDTVRAFARLASGRAGADTDAMIDEILPSIVDCHDCADFSLVPLIWSRMVWGEVIGEETRSRIDRAILSYRYWMDEPGNDVQWYFSENHALLFHSSAYLAGQLFPQSVFVRSGRKGLEQSKVGAQRVRKWLDHFEAFEMAEFNSAPYFPIDLKGLTALAALSPDEDIAVRAKAGIVRLCEIIARSAHHGMVTAAQGRSYEHTLCAGRSLELSGLARLLWGKGWFGRRFHALPQLAICMRDHALEIPVGLNAIANHEQDRHQEWRFAQGENNFAALYHYKGRHFAMGSAVYYRWNEWGYQETVIHLRIGTAPEATVWINHPGEAMQLGYARPSYWGGCGTIPRIQQYRGLAYLYFQLKPEQPSFSHAWFPQTVFDEARVVGRLAVGRSGGGAVLLMGDRNFVPVVEGPSAGNELRQHGHAMQWIVRVCEASELNEVENRFGELCAMEDGDGMIRIVDPEYGDVLFHADGTVQAEGRRITRSDYVVAGDVAML